jgi:Domain of unknown function (DUF4388)
MGKQAAGDASAMSEAVRPMQGNIRDFSLAEVLQFIALGRRTGLLEIQVGAERHRVYLRNGVIVGVNAVNAGTLKVLAEADLVPTGALEAALSESQREGRDLGAVLVQRGLVTAANWQRFVQRELERLLYRLFSLTDAPFSFQTADFPSLPPLTLDLPIDRAVLHGTRWAEAWTSLRPAVPSPHAVYAPTANAATAASAGLAPAEQGVLRALDRQAEVQRAASRTGLSLLETADALARLASAGHVRLVAAG